MKKVALCLSGQPRFIDKAYPYIYKNLIEPNNADVFVHTWYHKEDVDKPFRSDGQWLYNINNKINQDTDKLILDLYKPKAWSFEKQLNFNTNNIDVQKTIDKFAGHFDTPEKQKYFVEMMHSMWYSIYKSNHVKELYRYDKGIEYNFVIRCRFDAIIPRVLDCSKLDKNILYVSHDREQPNMVDDWFSVANNSNMNIYSNCFNFMDTLYDIANKRDGLFCNEILLFDMLNLFNVKVEILPNFKVEFWRPWTNL